MPFDPEWVLALARDLPAPRPSRSEAERRAAEDIAAHLGRLGLHVEHRETPAPWGRALARLGFLVAWIGLGVVTTLPATPLAFRAFLFALILLSIRGASRIAARGARSDGLPRPSRHVIGTFPAGAAPPVRIVVATSLRSPPSRWMNAWINVVLFVFVAFGVVPLIPRVGASIRAHPSAGLGLLAGQWLSLMFLIAGPKGEATGPVRGDNRTGLALLVELARTWPKGLATRAGAMFVASPDGLGRLLPMLLEPPGPTLLVLLDAPGVGPDLFVVGRGPAARLAEAAARDLWVPHRRWRSGALDRQVPRVLRRAGLACVALSGTHGDRPIDPALLAAAAQLVDEVALRWARRAAPATAQGASPVRSSQNPG
ncbi:MAG: hypothetical protein JO329_21070 [Planctomycetaceae bacterium]|nr:hypothetical protein [Planctomycetaceae bacterium]